MNAHGPILLVDDDADVRRSARLALLSDGGCTRVEELASPEPIDTVLHQRDFEVVLLDMNFVSGERDGRAGLDALARIRAHDPTLAVVLMTAFGGVTLAVESLKRGAVDFILKPWRNEKLIASVGAAAEVSRARRAAETLQLAALERAAIERALARFDGNISVAATALGLSRGALYRRMEKYGL